MRYHDRRAEAYNDLQKIINEHGITVTLDALTDFSQDSAAQVFYPEKTKAVWADLASAFALLAHTTLKTLSAWSDTSYIRGRKSAYDG